MFRILHCCQHKHVVILVLPMFSSTMCNKHTSPGPICLLKDPTLELSFLSFIKAENEVELRF